MIVAFSFRAKPGQAEALRRLLDDPDAARRVAKAMGAARNVLLWQGDRMVRLLEFPEGAKPVPLAEIARTDPDVRAFLQRVGQLSEPGFDVDVPGSLDAFNRAAAAEVLFDVRA